MTDYRVGMILKDRRNNPEGVIVITHLYRRKYRDGQLADRVVGLQIAVNPFEEYWLEDREHGAPTPGIDVSELRDLDARSVERMYPYVMFDPLVPDAPEQ
jgi:hypothetical protein